ncbi:MAG: hypothetical protein ACI8W7_000173 [Gammaproteobacteria bacterium]|jgi:hypothetical protein
MTRRLTANKKARSLSTLIVRGAIVAVLGFCCQAAARSAELPKLPQRLPGSVSVGPRLVEYQIECIDSSACRVQCYQHGVEVFKREHINQSDQLRMLASTNADGELTPQWIEIRAAASRDTRTVLLSRDTSCDLKSLIISP